MEARQCQSYFCDTFWMWTSRLIEIHELGVGEDLTGNADFLPTDPLFKITKGLNQCACYVCCVRVQQSIKLGKRFWTPY